MAGDSRGLDQWSVILATASSSVMRNLGFGHAGLVDELPHELSRQRSVRDGAPYRIEHLDPPATPGTHDAALAARRDMADPDAWVA